jgi:hypothetical protein
MLNMGDDRKKAPYGVLLLPDSLETHRMRDQVADLLRASGVIAIEPSRVSYGRIARMPETMAVGVAARQVRRMKLPGTPVVIVIFHPLQYPLARALLAKYPESELWYGISEDYETHSERTKMTQQVAALHELAIARATLTFAPSDALLEQPGTMPGGLTETPLGVAPQHIDENGEGEEGEGDDRSTQQATEAGEDREDDEPEETLSFIVPPSADSFPSYDPNDSIIAIMLADYQEFFDWELLQTLAKIRGFTLIIVGKIDERQHKDNAAYQACRSVTNFIWLEGLSDQAVARLTLCADVGLLPLKDNPLTQVAVPADVLKFARLGRKTITTNLAGIQTWREAIHTAINAEDWEACLRSAAGARLTPDTELREWARTLTTRTADDELWNRLAEKGIDIRV